MLDSAADADLVGLLPTDVAAFEELFRREVLLILLSRHRRAQPQALR
jgi:hypothetical protein